MQRRARCCGGRKPEMTAKQGSGPAIIHTTIKGSSTNAISNLSRAAGRPSGPDGALERPGGLHERICGNTRGVIRDIVISHLPHWDNTRVWVLARPLSGFAETFSHYLMDVAPGGGSELPEPDKEAEGALFVVGGELTLRLPERNRSCGPGALPIFLPAAAGAFKIAARPSAFSLDPQAVSACAWARGARRHRHQRKLNCTDANARYGWEMGDDTFHRSGRYQI